MAMHTDYVQMMLSHSLEIERAETSSLIESIEAESDYIYRVMTENSVLVEKTTPNSGKKSMFGNLVEAIQNIFKSFLDKAAKLIEKLKPWKEEYLDKLDDISYANISISAFPHWKVSANDIINEIKAMQNEFKNIKAQNDNLSDDLKKLYGDMSVETIVKNNRVLKKYHKDNEGYKSVMRMLFSTNSIADYKSVTISNDSEIKKICGIARDYILNYEKVKDSCDALRKELIRELQEAEREYERSVKESYNPYLILENKRLFDTDLVYHSGIALLEAANEPNGKDEKKEKPTDVEVQNDNKTNSNSDNSQSEAPKKHSTVATYEKNLAQINVDAIAVAISVIEEKLYIYKVIIERVIKESKGQKVESDNTDVESKKDTSDKKSKKK